MTISFNRLTLVERDAGRSGDGHILSRWICSCGSEVIIAFSRVKNGATKSCGCLMREASSLAATTHGGRGTPEYSSWMAMRRRCEFPDDKDYCRYGAIGITVFPEWSQSFDAFRDYVGPRPAGTTLDRIDSRKGYMPGNVRWAAPSVQGRNRRGTYIWHIRGRVFGSITEAAAAFSVSEQTIHRWVRGHYDPRRDRFTPPHPDCQTVERYS